MAVTVEHALRHWRGQGVVPGQIRRVGLRTVMLAGTYLVIVMVGFVSLALPTNATVNRPVLLGLCSYGMVVSVGLWFGRLRVSVALCGLIVASGGALVGVGIAALGHGAALNGGLQAVYANTYLWMAVYSLTFFSRRHAVGQIGFGALCYGVGILGSGRGAEGLGQVALQTASSIVIAFTTERVLGVARRLASNDSLTGLPNREVMRLQTERALRLARVSGNHVGMLVIDLDDFKAINDTRGHEVGDEVLRWVATQLKAAFRRGDVVTRLGGDEFVVVLPELDSFDAASAAAATARAALAGEVPESLAGLQVRGTVGLAVGPASAADDFACLLRRADRDMYENKDANRHRVTDLRSPRERVA